MSKPEPSYRWLCLAVMGWVLAYAFFTQHAWEDYYITYKASKNLATGEGLVFTVGQKVHTFTSPLGTLLPAAFAFLTGAKSEAVVLWLFRGVSALALGLSAVLLARLADRMKLGLPAKFVLLGLFIVDVKTVDFSINGMETGLLVFFLCLTLDALTGSRDRAALRLGLAWAGLMWTRPDCPIYIGALGVALLLFNPALQVSSTRQEMFGLLLRAAAVTTVAYLPWVLWAWSYYGSPIPHTIIAKGQVGHHPSITELLRQLVLFPITLFGGKTALADTFLPANTNIGEAATYNKEWLLALLNGYARALALPCALYWLLPFGQRLTRVLSFTFAAGQFYLAHVAYYPCGWYLPLPALLGFVVFAQIIQQTSEWGRVLSARCGDDRQPRVAAFFHRIGFLAVSFHALLTVAAAWQLRHQQRIIEDGHRKEIGLWLKEQASSPQDTVFLEPLGYIGYFSGLKMLDFPGLCSPEVVGAVRKLKSYDWYHLIRELQPDWLVLRRGEVEYVTQGDPSLLRTDYTAVRTFDATAKINAVPLLLGRGYLMHDAVFFVYRRTASGQEAKREL